MATNESELEMMARYLLAGGFVFGSINFEGLEKYGGLVAGRDYWTERLSDDHPVYRSGTAHQERRMMNSRQAELTETLVADLKEGALTEEGLRAGVAAVAAANGSRQDLLYLHCSSTSPASPVQGISLFEGGREQELSSDPEEWPYQSVLDAVGKGWRVISFPDMSLLALGADEFHGLGFLFVLERGSQ